MANFEGYTKYPVERFCSQVDQDDPINLPLGVQAKAQNVKFALTRIRSRDGINRRLGNAWVGMDMGTGLPVTGLECFKFSGNGVIPDKQVPMAFDSGGNLKVESPAGSGVMVPVNSPLVTPPANSYMQAGQTENHAFLAFTNVANPALQTSVNAVYDLNTGILDPHGMKPFGAAWAPNTAYVVGDCVAPILPAAGGNGNAPGKIFRCTVAGTTGAVEPVWPSTDGGSIASGTATFTENTPIAARMIHSFNALIDKSGNALVNGNQPNTGIIATASVNAGAGGFAAGRDIYVALTIVNGNGESSTVSGIAVSNTANNDQLQIKITTALRAWILALTGRAAVTGWNLYVTDVATGAAPPNSLALYGKVPGGPFSVALNTIVTVNSSPAGSGTYTNTFSPGLGDVSQGIAPTIGAGGLVKFTDGSVFLQSVTGLVPAPGTGSAVPTNNSAFIVDALGNIDPGTRYLIILFVNRNGYICGYGGGFQIQSTGLESGMQMQVFNIPIGPAQTAQRIIALSQANASAAGPFAYIAKSDTVNGVRITGTIINDNVTTTAVLNFTDIYLQDALASTTNVQAFFDKIQLPPCRSMIHSRTLDRMIYLTYNLPSGAYITPQLDPETIFASTSLLEVSETDGQNLMGWIHYDGIEWALKEESGHEVLPSADDPANWDTVEKWTGRGPCGLRAYAVGVHFFGFVHRSGVYLSFGSKPEWISKELGSMDDKTLTTWRRINWNAKATIWMHIDDDTHEIRVGVPLDGSTVPSHILKCNYAESPDVSPAIHSTPFSKGKFISTAAARNWSIDTIPANSCIRAARTVLNAPRGLNPDTVNSQILFASSFDSSISAITPGIFTDNGNLIDAICEGVAPAEALKDSRFGGVQALIGGSGAIAMTVLVGSAKATADGGVNANHKELKLRDAYVAPGVFTSYTCAQSGRGERFRLRISTTGKTPGTWFEVENYALFINPVFQVQASK